MSTEFHSEIAVLEAGYLNHLRQVNQLERMQNDFERISRELTEMIARLKGLIKAND